MKLSKMVPVMLLTLSAAGLVAGAHAKEINLVAQDGFKLKGDYFAGEHNKPGVLMLHQCNQDRAMYEQLGKKLAARGIHALSLDFRLFGESVTETVSLDYLEASEPDRQKRRALFREHAKSWPTDVVQAYDYLRDKMGTNAKLGVIGASCGGGQAIRLAAKEQVDSLIFFSSGMSDKTQASYHELSSTPTMIIAAEGDEYTFNSARQLFDDSTHVHNRLISYKGDGHGLPLFKQDPGLADNMVNWFEQHLQLNQK